MNKAQQIKDMTKRYSINGLCEYLNVSINQFTYWIKVNRIPNKYHRKIVEYFEICNDDLIDLLQKLDLG